jgi:DNA-binding GntR family transcriptional regulator
MNVIRLQRTGQAARWLQEELRAAIMDLRLVPGAQLSEKQIALDYQVSRQPVREALIALAQAQLVEIRPQRGSFVRLLARDRIEEARLMREAIETAVIERACRGFDAAIAAEIRRCLDEQELYARHGDLKRFQKADAHFHALLAWGAGLRHVDEVLGQLKLHTDRLCKLTLSGAEALPLLISQHRAIFAAVERNDAPAAKQHMHTHMTEILRHLPAVEAAHPDWFEPGPATLSRAV